ncbi:MAG: REP-associated tyrosine transposase [Arenicellales bacterium]
MARPLRIEFPGALYHVTSRGDRKEDIYDDDKDRYLFLSTLEKVIKQYNWRCYAYCMMTNHYHLIIETPDGNLSSGMRQLNGVFTQASNRRHQRTGHLLQGRYKAILVEKDAYLLELSRYVVLNPVRAGMVGTASDWAWSSYRATAGLYAMPDWLLANYLLSQFSNRRKESLKRYTQFVEGGVHEESPWKKIRAQIYLGGESFVEEMQSRIETLSENVDIPLAQMRPPAPPLEEIARQYTSRNEAIAAAYATGCYSYKEIGSCFNLHFTTIAKIVREQKD